MSSFKNSENIKKNEGGPDGSVSDNKSSSVTLNELAFISMYLKAYIQNLVKMAQWFLGKTSFNFHMYMAFGQGQ